MTLDNADAVYSYRIDATDMIVRLSENWGDFAAANEGAAGCDHCVVVESRLWDFIDSDEVRLLYGILLERIRRDGRPVRLPYRCDAPHERRFLQLEMVPHPEGEVDFHSSLLRVESRDPVRILAADAPRSNEFVKVCSLCKRFVMPDGAWVEVETALKRLGLFDEPLLPRLTHGLCPECYDAAVAELDA